MKTLYKYNIYTFISTFIRNIIDVYSIIYIYQLYLSIKSIILIYTLIYLLGIFITKYSVIIGSLVGYRYINIFSVFISSATIYIINRYSNPIIIALFISLSMFTFAPIKHSYGINILNDKKKISDNLIIAHIATLIASYAITTNININYLIIISLLGIIPVFLIEDKSLPKRVNNKIKIKQSQFDYFIFEQFKFTFILFEPLYIFLVANNIKYVGIYNVILSLSSLIFMYLFLNKININKTYKYINILFTIILLLKLNITNKTVLLLIAFLEGVGIKTNELASSINFYNIDNNNPNYIISCERIFCITRIIILIIMYILPFNLISYLYILLIGIFILSFKYKN